MIYPRVKKIIKEFELDQNKDFGSGKVKNCFIRFFDSQNVKSLDVLAPTNEFTQEDLNFINQFKLKPYKAKITISGDWIHVDFIERFIPYDIKKITDVIKKITEYFFNTYPNNSARQLSETEINNFTTGRKPYDIKSLLWIALIVIILNIPKILKMINSRKMFLEQVAEEATKSCPQKIDQYTTITDYAFYDLNKNKKDDAGDEFAYNYILTDLQDILSDEGKENFYKAIRQNLYVLVKSDDLKDIKKKQVNISFNYYDKDGNLSFRFVFTPEEYND